MSSATTTSPPNKDTVKNDIDVEDDDSPLLVSEFPPPPYYYRMASSSSKLQPPDIPTEALKRAANKAASMAAAAKEIAERNRLQAAASTTTNLSSGDGTGDANNSNNSETLAGSESLSQVALGGAVPDLQSNTNEEEDVVAVFGEIVEDPLLVKVEDDCENPTKIRDEVSRLNNQVLQGFVKLVGELVYRPLENKKFRDELSHNIFLMIQECNKFREHQARETLIELLEQQLLERQTAVAELNKQIQSANVVLDKLKQIKSIDDDETDKQGKDQ